MRLWQAEQNILQIKKSKLFEWDFSCKVLTRLK